MKNNAVLLSIQPRWCELIVKEQKMVEIRKTRPKLKAPFIVYIFETKDIYYKNVTHQWGNGKSFKHNLGKVIGEFICDSIDAYDLPYPAYQQEVPFDLLLKSCISYNYLHSYVGSGGRFYGWHISDLKIYNKPKELSEFDLKRAPQSWCYVKEVTK